MLLTYKNGQTSVVLRAKLLDSSSTTGAGLTGLTSASSGLIISTIADNEASATAYTVAGSTIESITTLGTFAAPTATKCRFKELDSTNHKGVYEFQFADARFAVSNAKSLLVSVLGATNLQQADFVVQLQSDDPFVAKPTNSNLLAIDASGRIDAGKWLGGAIPTPNVTGVPIVDDKYLLGTIYSTPATAGIQDVNVKNIDNDAASASGTVTFPNATLASTTNITAGTVTTATNVTTVNGLAAGVITAASIAADAITDAKVASDVTIASVTGSVGSVTGAVGSVTGNVGGNVTGSVGSVAAGGITAASFAADAITAAKIAADVGTEIGTAVWATTTRELTSGANIQLPSNGLANVTAWTVAITGNITGNLSGSVGSVTTVNDKTGYALTSGERTLIANEVEAQIIDDTDSEKVLTAITDKIASVNPDLAGLTLSAIASSVWSAGTRVLTAGTNIALAKGTGVTGFNDLSAAQVNAEVDTALADYDGPTHAEMTSELASADDATLAAIGALDGKFTFSVPGYADVNIRYVNSVQVNGDGAGTPWGP